MKETIRKIITISLVASMLTSTCISAFATDYDEPVKDVNGVIEGLSVEVIDGNITVDNTGSYYQPALEVTNSDEATTPVKDTSLEVTRDVEITRANDDATAVEVNNSTDTTLSLTIDGKVSATTGNDNYTATGIESENKGGTIIVEAKEDVVADDLGIVASSKPETEYTNITTLDDVLPYQDKVQLDPDYSSDDGSQRYTYRDENTGTNLYYVTNADGSIRYGNLTTTNYNEGSTEITVNGNVSGDVKVSAEVANNNIKVNADKNVTGGVSASSVEDSISSVNIIGNVNNEKNAYDVNAVNAKTDNGTVNVEIGGNASAINTNENYGSATGITASTVGDESDLFVSVGGSVTAETKNQSESSYYSSSGISSTNKGGSLIIDVGGDVEAEKSGISASSRVVESGMTLNDYNEVKDKSIQDETYHSSSGGKKYDYEDDNGVTAYFYTDDQGNFSGGEKKTQYTGSTGITVKGTVTGDVGASAGVEKNNITIEAMEDINGAVSASSVEGSQATVNVGNNVKNIVNKDSWDSVYAIQAVTTNGTSNIDVKGNAEVKNANTEHGGATGIIATTTGEESSLKVLVGGSLSAESAKENSTTTGISSLNKGGTIVIDVGGDIETQGTGIKAQSEASSSEMSNKDYLQIRDNAKLDNSYSGSDGRKK